MKADYSDIKDLIDKSHFILLSADSNGENKLSQIISDFKITHSINISGNVNAQLRSIKIDNILNGIKSKNILIKNIHLNSEIPWSRSQRKYLRYFHNNWYSKGFKFLIIADHYTSPDSRFVFKGGSDLLYMSDLAIILSNDFIILKNRYI